MEIERLDQLQTKVKAELENNILDFWLSNTIDYKNGGFYGAVSNDLIPQNKGKSLILNSRILWTFALAYRELGKSKYLKIANRAYDYLLTNFWDDEFLGFYWMLDYKGNPIDKKKQIYGQAFMIYALTEYYKITKKQEVLDLAIKIFDLIEDYSYDQQNKGYIEACTRDWEVANDLRLSEKDMNEKKSMNTHLHILEAYTNLYSVWKNNRLKKQLKELIQVMINQIIDSNTYHFKLFFDENWNCKSNIVSYGHDIEGSWLLYEAAEVLGEQEILEQVEEIVLKMAEVTYEQGIDQDGGVFYEGNNRGVIDTDKHWWPQAEAVVGFLNAYQLSNQNYFLNIANKIWLFIEEQIIDQENGEWFWKVSKMGEPDLSIAKVNPWKAPYHNGRACFEITNRLQTIKKELRQYDKR
ncbi:cellobiose 2-epimerase [Halanaerocella petrolearia]